MDILLNQLNQLSNTVISQPYQQNSTAQNTNSQLEFSAPNPLDNQISITNIISENDELDHLRQLRVINLKDDI